MNKEQCAEIIARLSPDGKQMLEEHIVLYGEVLLHILASELIAEPLIELLRGNEQVELIVEYCSLIELMWRDGDDNVVNVVDVTILERLSDEEKIWYQFGIYISDEFKKYINEEQIPSNLMMPRLFL